MEGSLDRLARIARTDEPIRQDGLEEARRALFRAVALIGRVNAERHDSRLAMAEELVLRVAGRRWWEEARDEGQARAAGS